MDNQRRVICPICGVRFRLPLGFSGGAIGCPGCWKMLEMSDPAGTPPPARWRSWLPRALKWLDSWRRPPDPAKSVGFLETRQWALDYSPRRDGDDYTIALDYAQKRHEEMLNLSELLDKKLDDLARTSLAIGVLIATVARVLGSETPLGRSPLLIWAVISFALSVLVAVWSRGPTVYGTPLEIRDLLKVIDDHPDLSKGKTEAVLASSYHFAVVGSYATNKWKAGQLWRATTFLLLGIVLLVTMLITAGSPAPSHPVKGMLDDGNPARGDAGTRTRADSSARPYRPD